MSQRLARLTSDSDFQAVAKRGRTVQTSLLRLRFLTGFPGQTRLGVVISSKFSKKATVRNRLRRQIREAIRTQLPLISAGAKVVISAKISQETIDFQKVCQNLNYCFEKAGLLKN